MLLMHAIAQTAASALVNCLVLGLVVAAATALLMRLFRQLKAGSRFAVLLGALGAVVLIPLAQQSVQNAGYRGIAPATADSLLVLRADWAVHLFAIWAVIAALGFGRVIMGALQLRRVRAQSSTVDFRELNPIVRETLTRTTGRRRFELRASDDAQVPMAVGFFRPAVVFPRCLLSELPPEQLNQLVLHEAMHLLRYDDWTNLLQKVLRAALFFHPAVWWLENKLTLEREMACDEVVVAETHDARSYAECLALLAERSLLRRSMALVQAAVSRLRHTSLRVQQVLAMKRPGRVHRWAAAASVLGVISCAVVLVQTPELVSFRSPVVAQPTQGGPETTARLESGVKTIPASLASKHPPAVPAVLKQENTRQILGGGTTAQRALARRTMASAIGTRSERDIPPMRIARSYGEPVPMLVQTTVVIESGQPGGQVWIAQIWRVALFYPAVDQRQQVNPRTI